MAPKPCSRSTIASPRSNGISEPTRNDSATVPANATWRSWCTATAMREGADRQPVGAVRRQQEVAPCRAPPRPRGQPSIVSCVRSRRPRYPKLRRYDVSSMPEHEVGDAEAEQQAQRRRPPSDLVGVDEPLVGGVDLARRARTTMRRCSMRVPTSVSRHSDVSGRRTVKTACPAASTARARPQVERGQRHHDPANSTLKAKPSHAPALGRSRIRMCYFRASENEACVLVPLNLGKATDCILPYMQPAIGDDGLAVDLDRRDLARCP